MGAEAEFADEHVKEIAPFGVVRLSRIEFDGDMGLDVDSLEDGDRWCWVSILGYQEKGN